LEKRMAAVLLSGQQLLVCSSPPQGSRLGTIGRRLRGATPASRPAAPEPEATGVDLGTPPHRTPAVQVLGSTYRPPRGCGLCCSTGTAPGGQGIRCICMAHTHLRIGACLAALGVQSTVNS
jgi:hypothetical protein